MISPVTEIEDFERVPESLILRMNDITRYRNRRFRTGTRVIDTSYEEEPHPTRNRRLLLGARAPCCSVMTSPVNGIKMQQHSYAINSIVKMIRH